MDVSSRFNNSLKKIQMHFFRTLRLLHYHDWPVSQCFCLKRTVTVDAGNNVLADGLSLKSSRIAEMVRNSFIICHNLKSTYLLIFSMDIDVDI